MKLWFEHFHRQQIGVHAAYTLARYLGEKIRSALLAFDSRTGSESQDISLSAHHRNSRGRVRAARISFAMHSLAVIAMTEVLQHRLAGDLYRHSSARTLS
jgi:hypothetical protein